MKKRVLSVFLSLCMMLTMVPAAFAAETGDAGSADASQTEGSSAATASGAPDAAVPDAGTAGMPEDGTGDAGEPAEPVARIGETEYTTLAEAISAVQAEEDPAVGEIVLLTDAELTEKVTISKDVTIIGEANTISGVENSTEVCFEITGGTLHISNATLTGFGKTAATTSGAGVFKIPDSTEDAKIVAEELTVEAFNRAAFDVRSGSFEITECTINCDNQQANRLTKGVVAGYSGEGAVTGTVFACTITGAGSTYEGWSANGIEVSCGANVTVEETSITSVKGGISVARNYGHGEAAVTVENSTIQAEDYALRIFERNSDIGPVEGSSATLTVNGGEYTGDVRISLTDGDESVADGQSKIEITGGIFSQNVEEFVAEGYVIGQAGDQYEVTGVSDAAASITADSETTPYATLESAVAAATSGQTVDLLKDVSLSKKLEIKTAITLNGNDHTITGVKESADVYFEITGGDVTIRDLVAKDFGGGAETVGQWGLFKVPASTSNAATEGEEGEASGKLTAIHVTASNFNRGAFDIRKGTFELDSCVIDCGNESESKLTKGVLAQDVEGVIKNTTIINAESTYTETGNAWNTNAVETWGNTRLTITGCTFGKPGAEVKNGVSMNTGSGVSEVTISDTTITAQTRICKLTPNNAEGSGGTSQLTVDDGYYTGTFLIEEGEGCTITVNGGYFVDAPAEKFIAEGKAAVASDKDGYTWMIGAAPLADVTYATAEPALDESKLSGTDEEKAAVKETAATVDAGEALAAAAATQAAAITQEEKTALLASSTITVGENETLTLYVQTYFAVTPKAYSAEAGTLSLDIAPMYRVIASTAEQAEDIVLEAADDSTAINADVVQAPAPLTMGKSVELSLQLPAGFITSVEEKVYVEHKGYSYPTTIEKESGVGQNEAASEDEGFIIRFTNPHGFSEFVITKAAPVAEIDGTQYATYEAAVAAATDGVTINILVAPTENNKIVVNGKTVTLAPAEGVTLDRAFISTNGTITVEDDGTLKITKPSGGSSSGGGGGGGGAGGYNISAPAANHGAVTVSPKSASKGDTVTITVKADSGYELDTLVVTDKNGDELKLTSQGNGKYTFTMPASKVEVKATFVKMEVELPFVDVAETAWYAEAVRYVYENGMMAGTGQAVFSPDMTTTRGMIVTILYRLENAPGTASSGFEDVPAGQYYSEAVAWAASHGIVGGYGNGKFGPNDPITREQMAAILYRYAAYKGYEVSGRADLNAFTDAGSISGYAMEAMAWANIEGLVNGTSATTLTPGGNATRAQVAVILMRFCENIVK